MLSPSLTQITDRFAEVLSSSPEIEAFCQEKYGKSASIFIGLDYSDLPKEQDCPFIILYPGVKSEGEDEEVFRNAVSVGWDLMNPNKKTIGKVIKMAGVYEVDQFGKLIFQAIKQSLSYSSISKLDYEIEPIEFFPRFLGQMIIQLNFEPAIGQEEILL